MDWDERFRNEDTPWERGDIHPAALNWVHKAELVGTIIIPGCGRSHEPLLLAQHGFQVFALDISETAITWQKLMFIDNNATGTFVVDSLLAWAPRDKVDAVYEQTCLCALPLDQRETYATQIHHWLKTRGILYANFMQRPGEADGPPFDCPIDDMQKLFPHHSWHWLDDSPIRTERTGDNHELGYRLRKR